MNASTFSIPGAEECPICFLEVTSIKVLPCSHVLCQACLDAMARSGREFPCHVCRRMCGDPDTAVTKFFGSLKCPKCLNLKDVEEFVWCKECERLLCGRCLAKDHNSHNGHTLLDWNTKDAYEACFLSLTSPTEEICDTGKLIQSLLLPVAEQIVEHLEINRAIQSSILSHIAESLGIQFSSDLRVNGKNEVLFQSLATLANIQSTPNMSVFGDPKEIKNPEKLAESIVREMEFVPLSGGRSGCVLKETSPIKQLWPPTSETLSQSMAKIQLTHQLSQNGGAAGVSSRSSPTVTSQAVRTGYGNRLSSPGGSPCMRGGFVSPSTPQSMNSQDNTSQSKNEVDIIQQDHDQENVIDADPEYFGPIDRTHVDKFLIGPQSVAFALIRPKEFHLWSEDGQYECYSGIDRRLTFIDGAVDGNDGVHVLSRLHNQWFYSFCDGYGEEYSIQISTDNADDVVHGIICCTDTGVPFLFLIEKCSHYDSVLYKFGKLTAAGNYIKAEPAVTKENFKVHSASAVRQANQKVLIFASDRISIRVFMKRRQGAAFIIESWLRLPLENCVMLPTAVYEDAFLVIENRNRTDEKVVAYGLPEECGEDMRVLWRKPIGDYWLALGANEKGIVGVDYYEENDDGSYETYEMHYL